MSDSTPRTITIGGNFAQSVKVSDSLSNGDQCTAENYSHAEGCKSKSTGKYSYAGGYRAIADHDRSYVWSGRQDDVNRFGSNGEGTFSIYTGSNNNLNGIYIDGQTLTQQITSNFDSRYSNKVLMESEGNVFTKLNTFDSIAVTGQGVGITTGANTVANFRGILNATTPLTSSTDDGRVATIGYVRAMLNSATLTSMDEFVHRPAPNVGVGSGINPIYVDENGTAVASISSVGGENQPIYLKDGEMVPLTANVGNSITPVYVNNGSIVSCSRSIPDLNELSRVLFTFRYVTSVEITGGTGTSNENYSLPVMEWYRIYSDKWCEQGGTVPFQDFRTEVVANSERYTKVKLRVPYVRESDAETDNASYQLMCSTWDKSPSTSNDMYSYTENKTYRDFIIQEGIPVSTPATYAHIRTYGGCTWKSMGYVSDETMNSLMSGLIWDWNTESWGGVYLTEMTSGDYEASLEPGKYRLWMVGKGGESYRYQYGNWYVTTYSGGAAGSLLLDIELTETTNISLEIKDDERKCICSLDNTIIAEAEYGEEGSGGNHGGTILVNEDGRITFINGGKGEDGTTAWFDYTENIGSFAAPRVYSVLIRNNILTGLYGCSGTYTDTIDPPGSAYILLFKHGNNS